jgi:AhpD family alkylhydroperoxidase
MYDMNHMKKMKKFGDLTPAAWQGFLAWDKAVMADGAIPAKTKELIALAVAMTTQCPYCIEIHNKIAEAVMVAAALRAGGAITHGTHCLE